MTPAEYVMTYLKLYGWINDTFALTAIKNYLQSGLDPQSANANIAWGKLQAGLVKLRGKPGPLPSRFDIEGDTYLLLSLWRVYNGKGAPSEIQGALWLASLCGLVTPATRSLYADTNLGIDCGGFVANYWGIGQPSLAVPNPTGATGIKPRTIWGMAPSLRRAKAADIRVGDAAVFFKDVKNDNPDQAARQSDKGGYDTTSGSQAFHIGLVAAVSEGGMSIAESSGAVADSGGNGVNVRTLGSARATVVNKLVYYPDGTGGNRIYFVGPQNPPNPNLPDRFGEA